MKQVLALASLLALAACSTDPQTHASDDDIVGGVDASGRAVAAVNGILSFDRAGINQSGCTGTLVSPHLVLTAKHCVLTHDTPNPPTYLEAGGSMEYRLGPSWTHPSKIVRVTKVYQCGLSTGGHVGLGCDVALLRLESDILDIPPLAVSATPLAADQIGTPFTAVGYGVTDAANRPNTSGTRKMASLTLRAVTGPGLHALYPTLVDFGAALDAVEGPGYMMRNRPYYEALYDQPLLEGYEALAGGGPDEAQDCHGDSGGPLLKRVDGKLVIYGVASTVVSGQKQVCENMGTVYATLGPDAHAMIAVAGRP